MQLLPSSHLESIRSARTVALQDNIRHRRGTRGRSDKVHLSPHRRAALRDCVFIKELQGTGKGLGAQRGQGGHVVLSEGAGRCDIGQNVMQREGGGGSNRCLLEVREDSMSLDRRHLWFLFAASFVSLF